MRFSAVTITSARKESADAPRVSALSAATAAAGKTKAAVHNSGGKQFDRRTGTAYPLGVLRCVRA
jgi:hypothetical protein